MDLKQVNKLTGVCKNYEQVQVKPKSVSNSFYYRFLYGIFNHENVYHENPLYSFQYLLFIKWTLLDQKIA